MRTHLLIPGLVLLLAGSSAPAPTYLIKTKNMPDAGKSIDVTINATNRMAFNLSGGGKVLKEEKKAEIDDKDYVEKVLQGGQDKPVKYSHAFKKAVKGDKNAPVEQSYAGKTIVFELKDGLYKVRAEGGGVAEKDLETFAKNANRPKVGQEMYSDKPVKVGEIWKVSKKGLVALMEGTPEEAIDLAKVVASGKLLKAYKKNGQQWGVIEVVAKGPMQKLGPLPLTKPIDFQLKAVLETAIDGSSTAGEMKGQLSLRGRGEFRQKDLTFNLDIDGLMEYRQVQSAEK
jgi:hypothetical protein